MKKKSLFKKLMIASMLTFMPMMTSCDLFLGGSTGIADIDAVHDDVLGVTVITITFDDEEKEPVIFKVPDGVQGVSIVDVKAELDGDVVHLTIIFSDPNLVPNITVDVPVIHGTDGRGIDCIDIQPVEGQEGTYEITIWYTDGEHTEPFTVSNGKDGRGIVDISITYDPFGNTIVQFIYTDGPGPAFTIYKAAAIASVTFDSTTSTEDTYVFIITFTDGSTTTFTMPAPQDGEDGEDGENGKDGSAWHCQNRNPLDEDGVVGDFWLNIGTGDVYHKEESGWEHVFTIALDKSGEVEEVYCDVVFHLNGGTWQESSESGYRTVLQYNYLALSRFPKDPTLEGYDFIGWYTSVDNINSGKLTDLTTITKDIHVYARWE